MHLVALKNHLIFYVAILYVCLKGFTKTNYITEKNNTFIDDGGDVVNVKVKHFLSIYLNLSNVLSVLVYIFLLPRFMDIFIILVTTTIDAVLLVLSKNPKMY